MISQFIFENEALKTVTLAESSREGALPVWVDLLQPSDDEIAEVDRKFGVSLPTLEKMREIEVSSRLYDEGGSHYMTFIFISNALGDNPEATPFTLMLKDNLLITIRYKQMRVVNGFIEKALAHRMPNHKTAADLMVLLLENIVDLCADVLEKGHADVELESRNTFAASAGDKDFKKSLETLACIGDLNSKMRESLASLNRLAIYLNHALKLLKVNKDTAIKVEAIMADVQSLLDHANFVSNKVSFLLDATLGLVNIEQNAIIKIFSVAAVIFLPPTLVASIYGMNFRHMPELEWLGGYPMALVLMLLSALLPYWYFKRKKWL